MYLCRWEVLDHLCQPLAHEIVERVNVRSNKLLQRLRHMLSSRLPVQHGGRRRLSGAAAGGSDSCFPMHAGGRYHVKRETDVNEYCLSIHQQRDCTGVETCTVGLMHVMHIK